MQGGRVHLKVLREAEWYAMALGCRKHHYWLVLKKEKWVRKAPLLRLPRHECPLRKSKVLTPFSVDSDRGT